MSADNIEANAENTADTIEANAENAADNLQANADNTADAVATPETTRLTPCAIPRATHTNRNGKTRHDRAPADKRAPFFASLVHFIPHPERFAVDG